MGKSEPCIWLARFFVSSRLRKSKIDMLSNMDGQLAEIFVGALNGLHM